MTCVLQSAILQDHSTDCGHGALPVSDRTAGDGKVPGHADWPCGNRQDFCGHWSLQQTRQEDLLHPHCQHVCSGL